MRVLRWVIIGVSVGVLAGFVGGLLRRHTQTPGGVTYVPPEPAEDAHVAPPYRPRPAAHPRRD